jgi:molybdopterin/thiamine biosynthesis adenylyltransferase
MGGQKPALYNPISYNMKKLHFLFLNPNWRFFNYNNLIWFLNLATGKQIKIEFKKRIEGEAFIFILNNFQNIEKKIEMGKLRSQFSVKFPYLEKKWFNNVINRLIKLNIFSSSKIDFTSLANINKYFLGLDRQIAWLDGIYPGKAILKQEKLKRSKIACLGVGAIGQYTLLPLIAAGIGNFTLVDFDKVEDRNIGRQPIFRMKDVGKLKTQVIGNFIRQNHFGTKVKCVNKMIKRSKDVEKLIEDSDIVIQSCDYPRFEVKRWINQACLKLRKPNIVVSSGKVGPFCIPYKTSCYGCYETLMKKMIPFYEKFTETIKNEGMRRYPEAAVIPSLCGAIAAREIIVYLIGMKPETLNAFFVIHPISLQIIKYPLSKQLDCYACGKNKK